MEIKSTRFKCIFTFCFCICQVKQKATKQKLGFEMSKLTISLFLLAIIGLVKAVPTYDAEDRKCKKSKNRDISNLLIGFITNILLSKIIDKNVLRNFFEPVRMGTNVSLTADIKFTLNGQVSLLAHFSEINCISNLLGTNYEILSKINLYYFFSTVWFVNFATIFNLVEFICDP